MKAFIKSLGLAIVVITALFIFKPYSAYAAVQYNDYQEQYNVSPNKEWKIKFNGPVSWFSAQNSITVYDSSNNVVPVTVNTDAYNDNVVVITPDQGYALGKRYCMIIQSTIYSSDTYKHLKNSIRMYFNIKTKLDPSDYNNDPGNPTSVTGLTGLVIIGTDRAYSVSYLLQHSDLANDLNGNPAKNVYYIPDATNSYYENIQTMFGDNVTSYNSMTDLYNPSSNQHKIGTNIVYTDAVGNNYEYVWNSTSNAYDLQTSGMNVSVTVPSTTGAASLTVNSVNAIPGAAYYKIDGTNVERKIGAGISNFVTMNSKVKITILSNNQMEMGYGYADISQPITNVIFPVTIEQAQGGNTSGNSNNNGSAVKGEDGYTYFLNSGDNDSIYKEDASGQYAIQIGLDRAQYMNEQDGWLYYSNYSDGEKLYRIRTDGTRREKICEDAAAYIVVRGDWVYYTNNSQFGKLYKIGISAGASSKDELKPDPSTYTTDASGIHGIPLDVVSSSQNVPYDETAYINVADNWIYYVNNSDEHKIYKIDTDGNVRTKVNDEWSACPQVVGNQIYYCSKTGEIMKIDTSGKTTPVDMGAQVNESDTDRSFHINVSGDWIYYSNKNDNKNLYKVKVDGSGEKYKLADMSINYVITAGDKLYIVANKKVYTLPIDTTGNDTPIPVNKRTPDNSVDKVDEQTKVVEYADVNQTIEWIEDKYLPDKVYAVMHDDTQQQLAVSWDTKNKTFNDGVYTYTGKLLGYDKTVTLKLIIPSQMLNGTDDVTIYNNPGVNDVIKISKERIKGIDKSKLKNGALTEVPAKAGDVIRVYGDPSKTISLIPGKDKNGKPKGVTVGSDGSATISGLDLDSNGKAVYITIQRTGKYESDATKILQMDAPVIKDDGNSTNKSDVDAKDNDVVCQGVDGRDFTIYAWTEAQWDSNAGTSSNKVDPSNGYNNLYLVPSITTLDVSNPKTTRPITVDSNGQNITVNQTGALQDYGADGLTLQQSLGQDSLGNKLGTGYYAMYISRYYDLTQHYTVDDDATYVTPDPNWSRPLVTAYVVSQTAAMEQVTAEKIPDTRTITSLTRTKPGDSTIKMIKGDDIVTLSKPLAKGEEMWFVPSTYASHIRGWTSEKYGFGSTDSTCLTEYLNDLNTEGYTDIVKVPVDSTDNRKNDFDLTSDSASPKLDDGKQYTVFIMNNVGAAEIGNVLPDLVAPQLDITVPTGTNGVNYIYNDATCNKITINTYVDNNQLKGTLYVLDGTFNSPTLADVKTFNIGSTTVFNGSSTSTIVVSTLTRKGTYPVTIVAVDAAGNISNNFSAVVTNGNTGGGTSN